MDLATAKKVIEAYKEYGTKSETDFILSVLDLVEDGAKPPAQETETGKAACVQAESVRELRQGIYAEVRSTEVMP